jgi:hypothetical protein
MIEESEFLLELGPEQAGKLPYLALKLEHVSGPGSQA